MCDVFFMLLDDLTCDMPPRSYVFTYQDRRRAVAADKNRCALYEKACILK